MKLIFKPTSSAKSFFVLLILFSVFSYVTSKNIVYNALCHQNAKSLSANLSLIRCPSCKIRDCTVVGGINFRKMQLYNVSVINYDKSTLICCSGIHAGVINESGGLFKIRRIRVPHRYLESVKKNGIISHSSASEDYIYKVIEVNQETTTNTESTTKYVTEETIQPKLTNIQATTTTSQLKTTSSQPVTSKSQLESTTSQTESTTSQLESTTSQLESNTSQLESTTSQARVATSETTKTTIQHQKATIQPESTNILQKITINYPDKTINQTRNTIEELNEITSLPTTTLSKEEEDLNTTGSENISSSRFPFEVLAVVAAAIILIIGIYLFVFHFRQKSTVNQESMKNGEVLMSKHCDGFVKE